MIRHIVLWKFGNNYSGDEKNKILAEMKSRLLALKDSIVEIQSLNVYVNDASAPETNYDVVLDSQFASMDALNAYQVHPEHQKVGQYIKSLGLQRAAIDYTL